MKRREFGMYLVWLLGSATALVCLPGGAPVTAVATRATPQDQAPAGNPHGPLAIACQNCHTTTSWKPIRPAPDFNHRDTRYPLQGRHAGLDCRQCHVSLVFSAAGRQCADCHADIHRRQLGSSCEQCHSVRGWRVSMDLVRNHQDRFPLIGSHAAAGCESCHKSAAVGTFRGLSTACVSCHLGEYQNAKSIDHRAAGFSTACETCHGMDAWSRGFDHGRFSGFVLSGMHAQLECLRCHVGGRFAGTPADCAGCHLAEYTRTSNPNHAQAGFPRDCSLCHGTNTWQGASYDHSKTKFPLTGAHAALHCPDCHAGGQYAGLPSTCVSCHLAQFNSAANPNHVTAGFPQDCAVCHSTTAWSPASFDHSRTRFPLTGAHTTVSCVKCHIGGIYTGTPADCYSCHSKEYISVTNPNHVSAGFPKDCSTCHNTSGWSGAVFEHTRFPIYSGSHAGKWTSCADCHTNSANYAVFTCISCHEHDKTTMDQKHTQVSNYVYNSANCYACHPTGRGD